MNATGPILLVEDSDDDIFFMRRAVKHCGLTNPLRIVRDGQAAIDYLSGVDEFADREAFPMPMMILLDLKMPNKTGLEVLEWIRSQPELRQKLVLILTTSREESDVQRAYALGANSYMVKPPDLNELSTLVSGVKSYWLDNPQLALPN
jgi:CheY-like chemotaxis protein